MEEPVPCEICHEIVELEACRKCRNCRKMACLLCVKQGLCDNCREEESGDE